MNADQYIIACDEMIAEDYIESVVDEAIIEDIAEEAAEYDPEFAPEIRPGHDRESEIFRLRQMAASVGCTSILYIGSWPDSSGTMRHRYELARPDGQLEPVSYWLATTAEELAEENGWIWIA